jgi:hypothetical protein
MLSKWPKHHLPFPVKDLDVVWCPHHWAHGYSRPFGSSENQPQLVLLPRSYKWERRVSRLLEFCLWFGTTRALQGYIQSKLPSSSRASYSMFLLVSCSLLPLVHSPSRAMELNNSYGYEVWSTTLRMVHSQTVFHYLWRMHVVFWIDIPLISIRNLWHFLWL